MKKIIKKEMYKWFKGGLTMVNFEYLNSLTKMEIDNKYCYYCDKKLDSENRNYQYIEDSHYQCWECEDNGKCLPIIDNEVFNEQ